MYDADPQLHGSKDNRLKLHVQAFYSDIAQLWDRKVTTGRDNRLL